MELLSFINKHKYKNNINLMPTFKTHYFQFERIRVKAPTFAPIGLYEPEKFSRGITKYNILVNIFDDSFEKLEVGQAIRIIYERQGTEKCYILRNIKDIQKTDQYLCNYKLIASIDNTKDYFEKEYFATYGNS